MKASICCIHVGKLWPSVMYILVKVVEAVAQTGYTRFSILKCVAAFGIYLSACFVPGILLVPQAECAVYQSWLCYRRGRFSLAFIFGFEKLLGCIWRCVKGIELHLDVCSRRHRSCRSGHKLHLLQNGLSGAGRFSSSAGAYLEGGVRRRGALHLLVWSGVHEPLPWLPFLGCDASLHPAKVVSERGQRPGGAWCFCVRTCLWPQRRVL